MCAPLGADTQVRPYVSLVPKLPFGNGIFPPKLCWGTARIDIKDNGGLTPPCIIKYYFLTS
jgi:hypothetical protein